MTWYNGVFMPGSEFFSDTKMKRSRTEKSLPLKDNKEAEKRMKVEIEYVFRELTIDDG